jgi:hypothetical protein
VHVRTYRRVRRKLGRVGTGQDASRARGCIQWQLRRCLGRDRPRLRLGGSWPRGAGLRRLDVCLALEAAGHSDRVRLPRLIAALVRVVLCPDIQPFLQVHFETLDGVVDFEDWLRGIDLRVFLGSVVRPFGR